MKIKSKSGNHKSKNTFKFQKFSERISNVDVDIFHHVPHEYETYESETESNFYHIVEKWNVLNLTEGFESFKREIRRFGYITLPQVLHNKDNLINILLRHVEKKDVLYLQPLLELIVALAKDLRKEFYPYYFRVHDLLIILLRERDVELIEWTFHCLAHLFKFLWRQLVKEIGTVFKSLLPLLSSRNPEYVVNFAAESFAFVARKVKDRKSFLGTILKVVKQTDDGITGCGRLFFEVINGVDRQFHSCADSFITFLFQSLIEETTYKKQLNQILEQLIYKISEVISPVKCDVLWKNVDDHLEKTINTLTEDDSEANIENADLLLKLLGQIIEYKGGKFLANPKLIIQRMTRILSINDLPESVLMNVVKICIILFLSTQMKLSQEQASTLLLKILMQTNQNVFLYFVEHTPSYISFESLILPYFLRNCLKNNLTPEWLGVLTKTILDKSSLCFDGINLASWQKYSISFQNHEKVTNLFTNILRKFNYNDDLDEFLCALIILPHLSGDSSAYKDILLPLFKKSCRKLTANTEELDKKLFVLNVMLECIIHMCDEDDLLQFKQVILEHVLPLCASERNVTALQIVDLYFTATKSCLSDLENLNVLQDILEENLNNPYRKVRLLTTHIFYLFEDAVKNESNAAADFNIFSLCYNVESIVSGIDTYREQLQNIEKMNYDKETMVYCKHSVYKNIPLRYLSGMLYINFKLLWEPAVEVIMSYALGMEVNDFWNIYLSQLKIAEANSTTRRWGEFNVMETKYDFIGDLYKNLHIHRDKPDFINYRLKLWEAMNSFPEIAESKTRDLSQMFLDFVDRVYMKSDSDVAFSVNIKKKVDQNDTTMEVDDDKGDDKDDHDEDDDKVDDEDDDKGDDEGDNQVDDEDDDKGGDEDEGIGDDEVDEEAEKDESKSDETIKKELRRPPIQTGQVDIVKLLRQQLQLFAKFKSPRSMYREQDLYKIYFDFLSHKSHEIQRAALDCLLTYKFKFLNPYSQNLYNLIDDKHFKEEIATFRIDTESSNIQAEHRDELLPYVMKIVFSKMTMKFGSKTGGRSATLKRRNMILRFLAGCKKTEMFSFIKMYFKQFNAYVNDDSKAMRENIANNADLTRFVPPKRLQSALNMLNIILEQFGNLMDDALLKYLLQILIIMGAFLKYAYEHSESVFVGYTSGLKNLRARCLDTLREFFKHFDLYPWNTDEIDSVFEVFVWPYLGNLEMNCQFSPSALLKLFGVWAANPRYYVLLVKYYNDKEYNPLNHIIKSFANNRTKNPVINFIMDMMENMLKLTKDAEEADVKCDNALELNKELLTKLSTDEMFNYGSCILLPHVDVILDKLKNRLIGKKAIYVKINKRDLFILSRISELVSDPLLCDSVLHLLIPVVVSKVKHNSSEDILEQLLTTVYNLLKMSGKPQKHIKAISALFGYTTETSCRKILCKMLIAMEEKSDDPKIALIKEIITEMNAYSAKWVDQPSFGKRLAAFKRVQDIYTTTDLSLELGVLVIYNCFYTIENEKDLSLRDNASHTLKLISPVLVNQDKKHVHYLLDQTLLVLIRNGFKSKNSELRNESISLLGHLARDCPTSHVILGDLHKLTNKVDPEVDFFENLTHLQILRHGRALIKFNQIFREELTSPNVNTLIQYVLPLATFYLCKETYAENHNLIEDVTQVVGTIARLLPWHHYHKLLKYYMSILMKKLDYQRQFVKLIVVILDSFHFDLSKAEIEDMDDGTGEVVEFKDVEELLAKEAEEAADKNESSALVDGDAAEANETADIVDVLLDDEGDEKNVEEEEEKIIEAPEVPVYERIIVLPKGSAFKITKIIKNILLPELNKALAVMTSQEGAHKVNKKLTRRAIKEDQELVKVPLSLAFVKLLQRLPKKILDRNLPGVFLKTCTFLKSRMDSVRKLARETLQEIMRSLGPEYLGVLFNQMTVLLSKGYQAHVLVFTIHAILLALMDFYKPTDIDKVLLTVLDICRKDLFGLLAEEKQVAKFVSKTSEAKSSKSVHTFQILARFITEKCLMDIILPIKEVFTTQRSYNSMLKAQECLKNIALGLIDNTFITVETLLKFAYGTASESIPLLVETAKPKLTEKEVERLQRQRSDCYIIPKEPVYKSGNRFKDVKSSAQTNAHLLVEFGLKLFCLLIKRDKLKDDDYMAFIDPFVLIFMNCLTSKHTELITIALQCMQWVLKYDVPALKENIKKIAKELFMVLHKYGTSGLDQAENTELLTAAFKAMAVLVREVEFYEVDERQLKLLLLYVDQDINDHNKRANAFTLLSAILHRKLNLPQLNEVMMKVAHLSIQSELTYVRTQARLVFLTYLLDYPHGNKLESRINFFLGQLEYKLESGRESAIEMLERIVSSLPLEVMQKLKSTFWLTIGVRLINENEPSIRKSVANCLITMLSVLPKEGRTELYTTTCEWMKERKRSIRRLGVQLCGLFVTVEKTEFETRLPHLMQLLLRQFDKEKSFLEFDGDTQGKAVRMQDHHLYLTMQLLLKICAKCPGFFKMTSDVENLCGHAQKLLGYPHDWVRIGSVQFLGYILASLDVEKLSELILTNTADEDGGYLFANPVNNVKSLALDLCAQLHTGELKEELTEQVVKNLIYIARVLRKMPISNKSDELDDNDTNEVRINLLWLVKRVRKIINMEVKINRAVTLRTECFKWIAGVLTVVEKEYLIPIMHHFLAPLVRELLTTEEENEPLRQLAKEVSKMVKSLVGMQKYTELLSTVQQKLEIRRAERKRKRNQLAVTEPEVFAQKKMRLNVKKKEARKRKMDVMKGKRVGKRKQKRPVEVDTSDLL